MRNKISNYKTMNDYFNEECYYHNNVSEWVIHYYFNDNLTTFVSYEKMGVKVAFETYLINNKIV